MKYLINGHVIFDSDATCLFSTDSDAIKVTLHTPASQCLLLLLQNKGEVLSQKFLFEHIWGKNGAFVSANALYQNIAIVRKCLKSAGIEEDVVQTIPKIGVKFIGEAVLYESSPLTEELPQEQINQESVAALPLKAKPEPEQSRVSVPSKPQNDPQTRSVKIKSQYYYLAAFVFCILCVAIYWQQKPENSFFTDYRQIGKVNGCTLSSSYYDKEVAIRAFTGFSNLGGVTCTNDKYAYLTINRLPEGTTILMCDQPAENNNAQCISYIYLEPTNDDH